MTAVDMAARRAYAASVLADYKRAAESEDTAGRALWGARLADALEGLLAVLDCRPATGLGEEQREVLAAALADASGYREGRASDSYCGDCDAALSGICDDHAADLDLHDAYVQLAAELGLELDR